MCLIVPAPVISHHDVAPNMGIDFENKKYLKLKESEGEFTDLVGGMLSPGEKILRSYKAGRDGVVFTDHRLIAVNVQGVTGKQKTLSVIPYSKISAYSVQTASVLDMDSTLTVWVSALGEFTFEFSCRTDVSGICRCINGCE